MTPTSFHARRGTLSAPYSSTCLLQTVASTVPGRASCFLHRVDERAGSVFPFFSFFYLLARRSSLDPKIATEVSYRIPLISAARGRCRGTQRPLFLPRSRWIGLSFFPYTGSIFSRNKVTFPFFSRSTDMARVNSLSPSLLVFSLSSFWSFVPPSSSLQLTPFLRFFRSVAPFRHVRVLCGRRCGHFPFPLASDLRILDVSLLEMLNPNCALFVDAVQFRFFSSSPISVPAPPPPPPLFFLFPIYVVVGAIRVSVGTPIPDFARLCPFLRSTGGKRSP